ncbi:hypothetical protein HDU97_007225 [Phlyctochytrium planicorne]|nr:hypothetical protein HDU97_007225 [Phlyctochytrium planicorne]
MACHYLHFKLAGGKKEFNIKKTATNNNRAAACGSPKAFVDIHGKTIHVSGDQHCNSMGLVCDEFPFHSTTSGGAAASVFCVPSQESSKQGGALSGVKKYDTIELIWTKGAKTQKGIANTCKNHINADPKFKAYKAKGHQVEFKQLTTLHSNMEASVASMKL